MPKLSPQSDWFSQGALEARQGPTASAKTDSIGAPGTGAQLDDYEAAISALVHNVAAEVYVYVFDDRIYPVVVGTVGNQCWLAMFSLDGVMETAFPPTDATSYLSDSRFVRLGTLQELGL